jgi:hypothetical protein
LLSSARRGNTTGAGEGEGLQECSDKKVHRRYGHREEANTRDVLERETGCRNAKQQRILGKRGTGHHTQIVVQSAALGVAAPLVLVRERGCKKVESNRYVV